MLRLAEQNRVSNSLHSPYKKSCASASLPVALVVAGTTSRQRVEVTTLACLEQTAAILKGETPVLMMMGEVVHLRAELGLMAESLLRSVA